MRGKVATFGVFDILHIGHIRFLKECKRLAGDGELIVVIARDSTVMKDKGRTPVFSEKERLAMVKSIEFVDRAVLGIEGDDKLKIVERINPDVIVLGYNQDWDEAKLRNELKKRGLNIKVKRMKKYADISSSAIRKLLKI